MEKIDFKTEKNQGNYAGTVRDCEQIYGKLTDKMFNLGQQIFEKTKDTQFPMDPKAWCAWMRRMDYVEKPDRVIFGMSERPQMWWIEKVFELYHRDLARHFDKRVYYAMGGKIYDLAHYETKKYAEMGPDEQAHIDDCWREIKGNIAAMLNKGKAA